jgi:hypothetical protein
MPDCSSVLMGAWKMTMAFLDTRKERRSDPPALAGEVIFGAPMRLLRFPPLQRSNYAVPAVTSIILYVSRPRRTPESGPNANSAFVIVKANLIFPKTANLEFPSSNVRMRG